MNFSTTETRWVKFGKPHDFVFVGKATIAVASGIYVSFFDLDTRERRIERFDDEERGDGASCLAGHPTVSMFSVVERRPSPRISIFMYPMIRRISRCAQPDKVSGYLSCSFAGTEYLVSLASFPDFQLIVWLWKTGKQVAVINTKASSLLREICCSPNPPHSVSQIGIDDGALSIYQVRACSKIVSVHHVDVPLPRHNIASLSWTPEGNLFVSDELGNVWLVAVDANELHSLIKSEAREPPRNKTLVVAYKGGVIVVNDSEITFYEKSSGTDWNVSWQLAWTIPMVSHSIRAAKRHCARDGIFFHSASGEIFEIVIRDDVPRVEIICTDDVEYKALSPVSRLADHVAAVDRLNRLCLFHLSRGKLSARLSLGHHGEVLRADSHPALPVLATCSVAGNCMFVDVTNVSLPKIFSCFHLHEDSLDRIRFSHRGGLLATGDSRTGRIFVIGKLPRQRHAVVLGLLEIGGHIADFLIYERDNDRFEMLVLTAADSSVSSIGGDKLIVYTCEISVNFRARAVRAIDLSKPFKTLYYGRSDEDRTSLLGVPSLRKQLYRMEIQNDFQDITLTRALVSMHQMRNIGVYATDTRVVTYGYDGLIVIRDSAELGKVIAIFMPHHRSQGGIKSTIFSSFEETTVSLGRNGDLVATRIRLLETTTNFVETVTISSASMEDFACDPSEIHDLEEGTWLNNTIATRSAAERDKALPLRVSILADLKKIKNQVRELLDINERERSDARLPVSAFELDRESRQRRIGEARLERDESRRDLEEKCAQRDGAASFLREIFWNSLRVKPRVLRSIGDDTRIQNYPLVESGRRLNDLEAWNRLSSDADEFLYSYDVYNEPVNDSRRGSSSAASSSSEEFSTEVRRNDESEIYEMARTWYTSVDEAERLCTSGVTAHKWIEDDSVTWTHQLLAPSDGGDPKAISKKDAVIENRERELKVYFNNLFEEMRRAKEGELKRAKERIDRLRYCASELRTMFGIDSCLESIEVPTWDVEEIRDYAGIAEDREISDQRSQRGESEIETVDEDREDEERAGESENDFRTEALEKMMDGVFEPKWEDGVKKEIPVPECLIAKDPSAYTDEDVAAVASYKSKVEALRRERDKYKVMLLTEIAQSKESLREDIAGFNDRLKDLELQKMQIDCAILQERLLRIRAIRGYRNEMADRREIVRFEDEELATATREARRLTEKCKSLEVVVSELKTRFDNLGKTEKRQEARFRGEFADLKQSTVEHLFRHYRKRPRSDRLVCTSVAYLTEVAGCILSGEKSEILPRDCLDFLKALDALDSMPKNLPSQISVDHWRTMCRLRRTKIELETKVRCCAVEIAETEQMLSLYRRESQSADNIVARKRDNLDSMKKGLARFEGQMEVQLVVKMGRIEVPLTGCPFDYGDAVLVTREKLLRVNDYIVEGGTRKLAMMRKSMHLRKMVSQHEWRHACAQMELYDLRQELKDIQRFKVTRNVLECLTRRQFRGVNAEKDCEKIREDLRAFRNKFRELLEAEQTRLSETKRLVAEWKRKNCKIAKEIESKSSEVEKYRWMLDDPCRKQDEESRRRRLAAIARRTELVVKAENNYEQLLTLHARLEVLKLRTYPTLRFKTA